MSNELVIQYPKLPLKAYPKDKLQIEMDVFGKWINDLLGLTGVDSAKRLLIALPAVEKHFWSLGFEEVQKAFTMYVDGQLKTQPLPNYFTRILVGQIFKEYKEQQPIKKKETNMPELSQEEKDNLIYMGVVNCFDEFIQTKEIIDGYVWVYDHLDKLKIISFTPKEKKNQMLIAKERLKQEKKQSLKLSQYAVFLKDLENNRKDQAIINMAKKMLLERFFAKLQVKDKHVKEIL